MQKPTPKAKKLANPVELGAGCAAYRPKDQGSPSLAMMCLRAHVRLAREAFLTYHLFSPQRWCCYFARLSGSSGSFCLKVFWQNPTVSLVIILLQANSPPRGEGITAS